MGKGIDLAENISPEVAQAVEDMRDQLVIVLINKLGGKVEVSAEEIDGTGTFNLATWINPETRMFQFEVVKK